ncbi:Uma2 family endonuclease [Geitlerinema sp. CS-897]|nr:Uma2 family endonuclease [Geitlerinema sp. CS-897]
MSGNATPPQLPLAERLEDWHPTPPTDLIFDDGEPLESNRHRIAMNLLIRSLQQAWRDRDDYFTGGNMFVYYSRQQALNRDFRGPDFFVVLNVDGTRSRQGWVIWEEEGRYPDVIVELMSPSTAKVDRGVKKELYSQTFHTRNYFIYDPFDENSLEGWQLDKQFNYQPLEPQENGWLWCETLGFWLGTWQGTIARETAIWLRFYDTEGNVVPLPEEAAQQQAEEAQQQAEEAQQRAERLAARLRELGEDPDTL